MYSDIEDDAVSKSGMLELPHISFASESFLDDILGFQSSLPGRYIKLLQEEYKDSDTKIETALIRACDKRDDEIGALLISLGVDVNRPHKVLSNVYPIERVSSGMPKTLDALIKAENIDLRDRLDLISSTYCYRLFDSFKILLNKHHYTDYGLQEILKNLCDVWRGHPKFTDTERQEWLKELVPLHQLDWEAPCKHLIYRGSEYHDIVLLIMKHHQVDLTAYVLKVAQLRWFDIAEILLASGVSPYNPNEGDRTGVNPYYIGIEEGCSAFVALLVKYGIDVNKYQGYPHLEVGWHISYNPTPLLLLAMEREALDAFGELLKVPGIQDKEASLERAVYYNKIIYAQLLIEHDADFNAIRSNGSILQIALQKKSQECVDYLFSLDSIDVGGSSEHTYPLFECIANRDFKNIRILLNRGVDINTERFEQRAIFTALYTENEEVIRIICNHPDIELNCCNRNDNTPITYVARENLGVKIAKILLDTGKINLKYDGIPLYHASYTSLHSAIVNKDIELVRLLLDYEPSIVNSVSKMYYSPLFLAIIDFKGKEICDILINAGADIHYTPPDWDNYNISQLSMRDIESLKYMLYEGHFDNKLDKYFRSPICMRYGRGSEHTEKIEIIYSEYQAFVKFGTLTESVLENVKRVGGWREDLFSSDPRAVLEARVRLLSSEFDRRLLTLPEGENLDDSILGEVEHQIDNSYDQVPAALRQKLITLSYYQTKYLEHHPEQVIYEVASIGSIIQATPRLVPLVVGAVSKILQLEKVVTQGLEVAKVGEELEKLGVQEESKSKIDTGISGTGSEDPDDGDKDQEELKLKKTTQKQRELLEGITYEGENPGNIAVKDGVLHKHTEMRGGIEKAKEVFERLTGKKIPEGSVWEEVDLPDGSHIQFRWGERSGSGHPKIDIDIPTQKGASYTGRTLEKITFK